MRSIRGNLKHFFKLTIMAIIIVLFITIFTVSVNEDNDTAKAANEVLYNTTIYRFDDNTGYIRNESKIPKDRREIPLSRKWANISIKANSTDDIIDYGTYNGYDAYGINASIAQLESNNVVGLNINYNYNTTENINGTGWNLSSDTATSVNNIDVGMIGSGALIVQKSKDGINWDRISNATDGLSSTYKTVEFAREFKPEEFYGTNSYKFYSPSGEDFSRGVYIRVLFAYELTKQISYTKTKGWWIFAKEETEVTTYFTNILEVTEFYLVSNSGVVAFNNFSTDKDEDTEMSEILQIGGTIKSGHGTLSGFSLNKLGNQSFDVQYSFNSGAYIKAEDKQSFIQTGRYDFKVKTKLGKVSEYTIYVNGRDVNGAIKQYLGGENLNDIFFTQESKRVYSSIDAVPVYVAGQAYYKLNDVGSYAMPLIGTITNNDTGKVIGVNSTQLSRIGTLTEAGNYVAEFYANPDYNPNDKINGINSITGDAYHFLLRFILIPPESVIGPTVNEELLNSQIGTLDFMSGYYGVTLPSAGSGKITFAYANYMNAYNFAYKYLCGFVSIANSVYTFENTVYQTQNDLLEAISEAAIDLVERRYFDHTDSNSFLTIEKGTFNVLYLNLNRDIVVAENNDELDYLIDGLPFLNSRSYKYINEAGELVSETSDFKFIQVADIESSSVILTHIETGSTYTMAYNTSVPAQLTVKNAPSGKYKITESNKYGDTTEYYAIYIRQYDILTKLNIKTVYNDEITYRTLDKYNDDLSLNTNGFVLESATNTMDDHAIIKIIKDGTLYGIYELSEVVNLTFEENGSYEIILIDRLSNFFSVNLSITNALSAVMVTFDANGGEDVRSMVAWVGITNTLPVTNLEGWAFKGWQTAEGTLYSGEFIPESIADLTLKAVWHYPETLIYLYNGELLSTIISVPESKVVFDTVINPGFTLLGWYYTEPSGDGRIYINQISSVPNVVSMRLDALWKRNVSGTITPAKGSNGNVAITLVDGTVVNTIYGVQGGIANLPILTSEGLVFFGWLYKNVLTGRIYGGQIDALPQTDSLVLTALWKKEAQSPSAQNASSTGTISKKIDTNNLETVEKTGKEASIIKWNNTVLLYIISAVIIGLCAGGMIVNFFGKNREGRNAVYRRRVFPAIIILLIITLAGSAFWNWSLYDFNGEETIVLKEETANVSKSLFDINASSLTQASTLESALTNEEQKKREEYIALSSAAYAENGVSFAEGEVINESDEGMFLYSLVLLDLLSMNYEVFPATAILTDGSEIYGYAYCNYEDIFENTDTNDKNVYIGAGFAAFAGQTPITQTDVEAETGIAVFPAEDAYDSATAGYSYVIQFEEVYGDLHYIAFDNYVTYGLNNYAVHYTSIANEESAYNLSLGALYSYDLGRTVYDPVVGTAEYVNAVPLHSITNYEEAETSFYSYIYEQNKNGLSVDTVCVSYISMAAINEYLANTQRESFCGLSPKEIQLFESQLGVRQYYYITKDGSMVACDLPEPTPETPSWKEIFLAYALGIGTIAIGIIVSVAVSVVTCGAAATAMTIVAGAAIGAGIEILSQAIAGAGINDINWLKVCVAGVSGALCAIPGVGWFGGALIGGATEAIMTAIDGGSLEESVKSFFKGVVTGVLIHGATKILGKVSSKIADKLGKCFVAGTAVLVLINGIVVAKNIEDIAVGDKVLSYNEFTGMNEAKEVTELFRSYSSELTRLTTSGGQEILSTPSHPYYTQRGYVDAQNLRAGDILHTVNGETVIVEAVQHELLESPQILYNFEVNGNNNYFVAQNANANTSAFILVHNNCNKIYIAKENKIYIGKDTLTNKMYVGRTKRAVADRIAEHGKELNNSKNKKIIRKLIDVKTIDDLSYEEARGLEQTLIEYGGGVKKLSNRINGIADTKTGKGLEYMAAAEKYIKDHGGQVWIDKWTAILRGAL